MQMLSVRQFLRSENRVGCAISPRVCCHGHRGDGGLTLMIQNENIEGQEGQLASCAAGAVPHVFAALLPKGRSVEWQVGETAAEKVG
jgi:hypothetical protein